MAKSNAHQIKSEYTFDHICNKRENYIQLVCILIPILIALVSLDIGILFMLREWGK